jgi:hypothetical protein
MRRIRRHILKGFGVLLLALCVATLAVTHARGRSEPSYDRLKLADILYSARTSAKWLEG